MEQFTAFCCRGFVCQHAKKLKKKKKKKKKKRLDD